MKTNLYCIKDTKLQKMAQPFCALNNEIAKRMLKSTINAKQSTIAEFPEDFELYKIGTFEEDTGELQNEIEFICHAAEMKEN